MLSADHSRGFIHQVGRFDAAKHVFDPLLSNWKY